MKKPTSAQARAGNYKMKKIRLHGLAISIETPKGVRRNPSWPPMPCHYGYIRGTVGRDGDHVDVMLGPNPKSELVVVVDQVDTQGKFDEHKCLIGFNTTREAVETYRKCYTKGWKVGPVTAMTIDQFKRWLAGGSQRKRLVDQVSKYSARIAGNEERWVTVRPRNGGTGHPVLIDQKGVIKAGMGGKFNGKNIRRIGKQKSSQGKTQPGKSTPPPGSSSAPRNFAESIQATIREHEASLPRIEAEEARAKAEAQSHPHHHSKLSPTAQQAVLRWHEDANELVEGIAQAASSARISGGSEVDAKRKAWDGDSFVSAQTSSMQQLRDQLGLPPVVNQTAGIDKEAVQRLMTSLREMVRDHSQATGQDLKPFIRHNKIIPRELAAKLDQDDALFHPVEEHERFAAHLASLFIEEYSAKGPKNSPGQLDLFTGKERRSAKTQGRLFVEGQPRQWDESKHPRAKDGRFGRKSGQSKTGKQPFVYPNGESQVYGEDGRPANSATRETQASSKPKSPRESASQAAEEQQGYEFARPSAVGNAGEDLKGSARHIRNAWRSLEDAEREGTAKELVTRDKLLKNEPHSLMDSVDSNPEVSLVMHLALKAFPAKPKSRRSATESEESHRSDFLDAFRSVKEKAEDIAKSESDPYQASKNLGLFVKDTILSLRGEGASGGKPVNRYNATANDLVSLYKKLTRPLSGKTTPYNATKGFVNRQEKAATDRISEEVKLVFEGAPLKSSGSKEKRWKPSDMYVSIARRKGGPSSSISNSNEALNFMVKKAEVRGVQFGNSVTDDERMHHAKQCAEALLDLADVTGLPLSAIGLNGNLGIAIGARGKGGALAHYEPGTKVINMTRKKGVGSLAHEWGHALDDAMGDDKASFLSSFSSDQSAMGKAMNLVRNSWSESGYDSRLRSVIRETAVPNPKYWNSREEKFARTFERYVQLKLSSAGRANTYLAGIETKSYKEGGLWPTDEEVKKMTPVFDALMDAYRQERLGVKDRVKYSVVDRNNFTEAMIASFTQSQGMHDAIVEHYRTSASPKVFLPSKKNKSTEKSKEMTVGKYGDRGRYVTINGHPVFVESNGVIGRGPRQLKGKRESDVEGKRSEYRRASKKSAGSSSKGSPVRKLHVEEAFVPRSSADTISVEALEGKGTGKNKAVTREDVEHFKSLVDDAHSMLSSHSGETNHDMRELLGQFGIQGRRISGFQATARRASDGASIPRFDEMVEYAKAHFPHLLDEDHGESAGKHDDETALLNRIKRGFEKQRISKKSPEVLKIAGEMYDQSNSAEPDYDPDDYIGGRVPLDENDPFSDYVPFASRLANVTVER